jgi:hypothetical protein
MQQGNFIDVFSARHVSGTQRPSSGALDIELQHMVFCTSISDAPDDGCMYPETCRARNTSIKLPFASSWHFKLFHEEDARSNNPQITSLNPSKKINYISKP